VSVRTLRLTQDNAEYKLLIFAQYRQIDGVAGLERFQQLADAASRFILHAIPYLDAGFRRWPLAL
jgi:hypothetical protein